MKIVLPLRYWAGSVALSIPFLLVAKPGIAETYTAYQGGDRQQFFIAQQPSQSRSNILLQQQGTLERGDTVLDDDGSFYDQYTFAGQAGQQVTIVLESNQFDTYLILLDPNGDSLAQNDDASSTTTNSTLTFTLPSSGTYTVVANTYDDTGRGQYTLTINASNQVTVTQATSPQNCQSAVTAAQNQLEESGDLQVSIRSADVGYYSDHPIDRSQEYIFAMRGSAVESVMRSRVLLATLSTNIIQNCDSIGVVSFGLANSGWHIPFGLFPDGQIKAFECAEDFGIEPGRGNSQRLRWGMYYCSI